MNGHHARKRFGQHFLHDDHVINQIIHAIHPTPGDAIVEIGPGLGALTEPLLHHHKQLDAIELDRDVVPKLAQRCRDIGELRIHQQDVLKTDFRPFAATSDDGLLRVVGNLPYNISTPLLFHLLTQASVIKDMHFMLQREVVERLCAQPNTRAYGRLTIMLACHAHAEYLFTVPPSAFSPPPKVDSAVVRITPYATPPFDYGDPERFSALVRAAFNQRRKTLRNSLKNHVTAQAMEQAGIDPGARAQTLSPADFGRLNCLNADN